MLGCQMTRRALVAALCAHPRAHLRELRPGVWALAVLDGVRYRPVTEPAQMAPGEVITTRARVAHVREHLSGEWVRCDGWSRQRSIADVLTAYAWADGIGRLTMHEKPAKPPAPRDGHAAATGAAHPAQLELLGGVA